MTQPSNKRGISEQEAIRQVATRLAQQFPELSAEEVDQAVRGQYDKFGESPIRDFVPVLVERATRQQLYDRAKQHRA
jgi:hypothetical protein